MLELELAVFKIAANRTANTHNDDEQVSRRGAIRVSQVKVDHHGGHGNRQNQRTESAELERVTEFHWLDLGVYR